MGLRASGDRRPWFKSGKAKPNYDDIPILLPETVDRGSLYVPPEKPAVIPLADREMPYGVPNAKSQRRKIKQARLRRENEQRKAAGLPPVLPPAKAITPKPVRKNTPARKRKPAVKRVRVPVYAPVDRASILAELRSRKNVNQ